MTVRIHWDLGDGLEVRSYTLADAEALFALVDANRAHLRPWMMWEPTTKTVEDVRAFIQGCLDHPTDIEGNGIYLDGKLVGGVGLTVDTLSNAGEIGYWLDAGYEGRGIVTRVCRRFFDFAFDELGLHRIELHAAVTNVRSRAVAERLGMRQEGVAREGHRLHDGYVDVAVYGILEDEWRAARG